MTARRASDKLLLRTARVDDFPALGGLWQEMYDQHARLMPSYFRRPRRSQRAREELERILRSPDEAVFVADEIAGGVLGLVHVQLFDTPPAPLMVPKRRAHIDSLVVEPAARRRGVGRRLVEEAEGWARTRGAEEILLTVWSGNQGAEDFYASLGFKRVSSVLAREI